MASHVRSNARNGFMMKIGEMPLDNAKKILRGLRRLRRLRDRGLRPRVPASASKCQRVPASASKCQQVPASAIRVLQVRASASECERVQSRVIR